ncbi:DMT family transporter [Stappia sp. WLB 29]|uniref:DMT family transporter n=1 Tax=Stappia sp. WLB 29 TaxID=2925220 RepID=UPI0020BF6CC9|nr:DMT family transporter [Stappia sp. WLB 29]
MDSLQRAVSGWHQLIPERFIGIALICFAFLCFSCLDTTAKYLGQYLPTEQVVWMRFMTHIFYGILLFRLWRTPQVLHTRRWGLQILRALCLLGSTAFNFFAIRYMQLAETVSIMFATPFVVTALAGPLLNEWAGLRRWMAIIVGFIGILVVTRPGFGEMHWAALLSVCSMLCYAIYVLTTRMLTQTDSPVGMLMISAIVAATAIAPFGISAWQMPSSAWHWVLLLATGALGGIGHFALIRAHVLAPAPVLAPFMYTQILWMVALGYLVFADVPTVYTVIGASIVTASGLYILYRERKISKAEVAADAASLGRG